MLDQADPDRVAGLGEPQGSPPPDDLESPVATPIRRPRRPNRFDRPKPPHDWRWVVGGIGRVLIATGMLMFGFVAYQLWGTALQTAATQNRLESDFDDLVESMSTLPFPGGAPSSSTAPAAPVTTALPDVSVPADATTLPGGTEATPANDPSSSTAPPTAPTVDPGSGPAASTPAATAPPSPIPTPEPLEVIGRLQIPTMGVDDIVVQGVTRRALKAGPGHFPETPLPGQLGNAAIAGHRTTYGAPFGNIDRMEIGDEIVVTVPGAGTYYYVTDAVSIVAPEDYGKVMPGDPNVATLILVSCHPKYTTNQRMIVHATLDAARSNIVTQPSPLAAPDSAGELPTEDVRGTPAPAPADTAPPASADTVAAGAAAMPPGLGSGAGSKRLVLLPAVVDHRNPAQDDAGVDDGEDAFSAGWFSDDDAWPQVAFWGLLLTAISLGAYWVSRRTRRNWVGALVGIAPFVVALYFFYENVNRLLPPAL